jgi:hypothetical protein
MVYNFSNITELFNIEGETFEVRPFGSGHINDTYLVKDNSSSHQGYLLQKINNYVFKDVAGLMNNMLIVVTHLKQKALEAVGNPDTEVLTLIPTKAGNYFVQDEQGNFWRMILFLENTSSYDLVTTTKQAYQGGLAFGKFQMQLSDLSPSSLVEVIPDFLNIEKRLKDFRMAIDADMANRLKEVTAEVDYLNKWAAAMNDIIDMGRVGLLPLRITHNDTKFNNILLDKQDNIQCVIDLDTVMPGYAAYDFGDAIRSIINTAAEDEKDLSLIKLNIPLFIEFTKGYLKETASFLNEYELKSLVKGVLLLPYMQSVRFLTDYLQGDVYYKMHFPGHNLQRTRAQMQLFKMLEANREQLNTIVFDEYARLGNKSPVNK